MAIDNQFGKGIGLAAGFDLGAQKPLDSRVAVNTIAERDAHVTENRAYEGMLVYVAEANMTYQLVKGEEEGQLVWVEFKFNQADFDNAIVEVEDRLDALEGIVSGNEDVTLGDLISDVADNKAAIDKLNGADNEEGSVAKAVKDAVDAEAGLREEADNDLSDRIAAFEADGANDVAAIEARVKANEDAIDVINGEGEGSIKKAVADLVDAAPEDLNTLNELAAALRDKADVLDAVEKAFDDKLALLQADVDQNEADCDAAIAGEKERAEKKEGELAQAIIDAIAQEVIDRNKAISDESALRVAEEQRIEKECDDAMAQEVLDRNAAIKVVADELDKQKDAAQEGTLAKQIADEKARAEEAEGDLQDAIDLINGQLGNGGAIESRIAQAESDIDGLQGLVGVPAGEGQEASGLHLALNNEIERAEAKELELQGAINTINNAENGILAQAKAHAEAKDLEDRNAQALIDQAQDNRIKALEDDKPLKEAAIKAVQDDVDANEAAQALVNKALQDEDARIVGLVEAEATEARKQEGLIRQEMADAVAGVHQHENKEVLDGIDADKVAAWDAAQANAEAKAAELDAALKLELQGEIDADVKVVADELTKQKDAGQEGTLAHQISLVTSTANTAKSTAENAQSRVATAEEKIETLVEASESNTEAHATMNDKIAALEEAIGEGGELEVRVKANEDFIAAQPAKDKAQEDRIKALEDDAPVKQAAIEAAQAAADKAQDEVDALETVVGNNKTACEEAMAQEVIDRNQAIATAESEMKTMLANVVNSLGIALVEDKLQLTLGIDSDPIVIKEVELNMVTDDDIDEIIAELDAPAAE